MSFAATAGVVEVVELVTTYAPQLISDITALSTLYGNAATAVAGANPDGSIQPGDWATLLGSEAALRAKLDQEVAGAEAAATVRGAG